MSELFQSYSDLESFIFRITDNGGATSDNITVLFCDGDSLILWGDGGAANWYEGDIVQAMQECVENGKEVDLQFGNLSEANQRAVLYRLNEAFGDYLAACEAGEHIAPNRDAAEENEGTHDSYGVGIYTGPDGKFYVRRDQDDPEDDGGPFDTVREALLYTLPEDYSLAGPEYHSPYAAGSINASPEAAEALAALRAKVEAES